MVVACLLRVGSLVVGVTKQLGEGRSRSELTQGDSSVEPVRRTIEPLSHKDNTSTKACTTDNEDFATSLSRHDIQVQPALLVETAGDSAQLSHLYGARSTTQRTKLRRPYQHVHISRYTLKSPFPLSPHTSSLARYRPSRSPLRPTGRVLPIRRS